MKKNLQIILIMTLFTVFGVNALAQKGRKASSKAKVTGKSKQVQNNLQSDFYGETVAQTYKNRFFGVKLIIPESWLAQGNQVNDAIKETGSQMMTGKTPQTQAGLNRAIERLTILFTASKDIMGIENNALIVLSAEKMAPLVQIRDGRDYLRLNIQSFKKLQMPPDFKYSETINAEKFGSETFYSLDIERAAFRQKLYAISRKGYALFFTLTYHRDEDLETMKNIMRNADFSWQE